MNGVEIERAREDGRRAARKEKLRRQAERAKKESENGLKKEKNDDLLKNAPHSYDEKKPGRPSTPGKDPGRIVDPGPGSNPNPGGDPGPGSNPTPGGDPGPGVMPIEFTPDPPEGPGGDPVGPGVMPINFDPDSSVEQPPVAPIDNKNKKQKKINPGKGGYLTNSLIGKDMAEQLEKAIKKAKENGDNPGLGVEDITNKIPNPNLSDYDKEELMRKILQEGIDSGTLTKNGKGKASKDNPLTFDPSNYVTFPMIDWDRILAEFLAQTDVKIKSYWGDSPYKHGDLEYDFAHRGYEEEDEDEIGHLVISIDTSGSVSEAKIGLFINQIGAVLDATMSTDFVVDVVKCAYSTATIDRFYHHHGNFKNEIGHIRQKGERGGTNYSTPLKYFHYAMMSEEDRNNEKYGYEEFLKNYIDGGKINCVSEELENIDDLPPATGFILFTDGDFFGCGKYYGNMNPDSAPIDEFVNSTCFFIGLDSDDVTYGDCDLWGHSTNSADAIFADRIHVCSMSNFYKKLDGVMSESAVFENQNQKRMGLVRRKITAASIDPVTDDSDATEKPNELERNVADILHNNEVELSDKKVNFTVENQPLITALEILDIDYWVNKADGIVTIKEQTLNADQLQYLAGLRGKFVYNINGVLTLENANLDFFINNAPNFDGSEFAIAFKNDDKIDFETFKQAQEKLKYIKYVNCKQITTALMEKYDKERPNNPFNHFDAFTNDPKLAVPFIEKYIEAVKGTFGAPRPVFNGGINSITMFEYQGYPVVLLSCNHNTVNINFSREITLNKPQDNANYVYGDGYYGFPPFVVVKGVEDFNFGLMTATNKNIDPKNFPHVK